MTQPDTDTGTHPEKRRMIANWKKEFQENADKINALLERQEALKWCIKGFEDYLHGH